MQNSRIKGQSNCIRSGTVNLGHPVIRRPPIRSICKSKTRNWGNSKLLGRITVTVFNVPFPYIYHFPNLSKIRGAVPLVGHHSIHQIWAYAHLFGTLIYSICKISSIFDGNTWRKNSKYKTFFYLFWKVWTINTLSLNSWVGEAYISIRLENGYIPEDKHG